MTAGCLYNHYMTYQRLQWPRVVCMTITTPQMSEVCLHDHYLIYHYRQAPKAACRAVKWTCNMRAIFMTTTWPTNTFNNRELVVWSLYDLPTPSMTEDYLYDHYLTYEHCIDRGLFVWPLHDLPSSAMTEGYSFDHCINHQHLTMTKVGFFVIKSNATQPWFGKHVNCDELTSLS